MTNKEWKEIQKNQLNIFSGILFHNQTFVQENEMAQIRYDFSCPEFLELREKYDLEKLAGRGSDFARSKRLLHYLAPRLHHCSWYDNHVPCNALALLEYSLDQKEHGINCLNKAKILAECCLAVGIYARRVRIMPYSPYDFDNHVVTEIYDKKLGKWMALDPTTDGYFVDERKTPLSLPELRDRFANDRFATFVRSTDRLNELTRLRDKYSYYNTYICKNLFYFSVEQENRFGSGEPYLHFCPESFSIIRNRIGNTEFRINHMPEAHQTLLDYWKDQRKKLETEEEPGKTCISVMQRPPEQE